jgi:trk system potassium uptake protein TrkH
MWAASQVGRGAGAKRAGRAERGRIDLSAPRLLVGSFAILVTIGTAGFLALPQLWVGEGVSLVDALFLATSAVCVTGLSVVDVSSRLTGLGQLWLLLLIQAGGLGILSFAALAARALGQRASLELEEAVAGPASLLPSRSTLALVRAIVAITLLVEGLGALALWLSFRGTLGAAGALWPALFHAVSAFCNAGFSTFRENLAGFAGHVPTLGVVSLLVVVGGIGFPVLEDVRLRITGERRRLFVHTRVVLVTTAALVVVPAFVFLALEASRSLAPLPAGARLANAIFLSITPRTAGFNAVAYDQLSNPSILLTLGLMWVGGSPASTAGGVKTTTLALLVLFLVAKLRGRSMVSVGHRTLPDVAVQRAAGLAVLSLAILGVFVFLLLWSELAAGGGHADRGLLIRLLFEAQSALGTVGLSMDHTTRLTPPGRVLIAALMFIGRVGPLAVVGSMALRARRGASYRLAREDLLVG